VCEGAGRKLGLAICGCGVGVRVLAGLIQVVFLDVWNKALPWTDEAARVCMLWMAGLMAPTAFGRGGFVAIDIAIRAMPRVPGQVVTLLLLLLSMLVLVMGLLIGWGEVTGFGGKFATASLYVPTSFGFDEWYRVPRSWMMASLLVGIILLISVNVELILRSLVTLLGGQAQLAPIPDAATVGAD